MLSLISKNFTRWRRTSNPKKTTPIVKMHDAGLVFVEDQALGAPPRDQSFLDLFRLFPRVAQGHQIIDIPDQSRRARFRRPALRLVGYTGLQRLLPATFINNGTGHPAFRLPRSVGANRLRPSPQPSTISLPGNIPSAARSRV